jgi:hypothetical protein
VLQRVEEFAEHGSATEAFVHLVVSELTGRLSADEIRDLALVEAFQHASARHPRAVQARGEITALLTRNATASHGVRPGAE